MLPHVSTFLPATQIAGLPPATPEGRMAARRRWGSRLVTAARDVVPARYLRVVTFQPDGHESSVDAALRDRCLPALLDRDAVIDAWIGRHGTRTDHTRVIASTWSEPPGAS